jgi:predicted permease
MSTLVQDIRYAVRLLIKGPGFTIVAVLALSLGIGANTAIFTLINGLLLRPMPGINESESLVGLGRTRDGSGFDTLSYPDYLDYRDQASGLTEIAAVRRVGMTLTTGGSSDRLTGALVSGNYFQTLRTGTALGRALGAVDEGSAGENPVVVVGHRVWQERLGGDPEAIGRTITLNGYPLVVVGVTEDGFRGTQVLNDVEAWVPITMQPQLMPRGFDLLTARGAVWMTAFGRLADGVSLEQARAELTGIAGRLEQAYPESNQGRGITVAPGIGLHPRLRADIRNASAALMVVVLFVLLIAAANIANLLLARAVARQREMGIRMAIGASRLRLLRQLLVESLVLSLLGGGGGLVLTIWGTDLLRTVISATPLSAAAGIVNLETDMRILGFTLAVSLLTGIVFGLAPALSASRARVTDTLKGGLAAGPIARSRFRGTLVVGQLALSLVLLVAAGLFLRSLGNFREVDPGTDIDRVAVVGLDLNEEDYPEAEARLFFDGLIDRIGRIPAVSGVSLAHPVQLSGSRRSSRIRVPGFTSPDGQEAFSADYRIVTPGYFRTMGIPLISGRTMAGGTATGGSWEIIVNQTAAQRYWPGANPLGEQILFLVGVNPDRYAEATVVGVARDVKYRSLDEPPQPHLYVPLAREFLWSMSIHIRSENDPLAVMEAVRAEVTAMDANLPLIGIRTLEEQLNLSIGSARVAATLAGLFALLAVILAALGLYGALSHYVRHRTHEIGVRMALGAESGLVLGLIVRQGLRLVGIGMVIGIALAIGLTRILASELYGVSPTDPLTFFSVLLLLSGVALLAAWLPARRATRVDPVAALRYE